MDEFAFLIFSLGFFIFMVHTVTRDHRETQDRLDLRDDKQYARRIEETRESRREDKKTKRSNKEPKNSK